MDTRRRYRAPDTDTFARLMQQRSLAGFVVEPTPPLEITDVFLDTRTATLLKAGLMLRLRMHAGHATASLRPADGEPGEEIAAARFLADDFSAERSSLPPGDLLDAISEQTGGAELIELLRFRQFRTPRALYENDTLAGVLSLDVVADQSDPDASTISNEIEAEIVREDRPRDLHNLDLELRQIGFEPDPFTKFERGLMRRSRSEGSPLLLLPQERRELVRLKESDAAVERRRAEAILLSADGVEDREISRHVGLGPSRVRHWRQAFREERMRVFDATAPEPEIEHEVPEEEPTFRVVELVGEQGGFAIEKEGNGLAPPETVEDALGQILNAIGMQVDDEHPAIVAVPEEPPVLIDLPSDVRDEEDVPDADPQWSAGNFESVEGAADPAEKVHDDWFAEMGLEPESADPETTSVPSQGSWLEDVEFEEPVQERAEPAPDAAAEGSSDQDHYIIYQAPADHVHQDDGPVFDASTEVNAEVTPDFDAAAEEVHPEDATTSDAPTAELDEEHAAAPNAPYEEVHQDDELFFDASAEEADHDHQLLAETPYEELTASEAEGAPATVQPLACAVAVHQDMSLVQAVAMLLDASADELRIRAAGLSADTSTEELVGLELELVRLGRVLELFADVIPEPARRRIAYEVDDFLSRAGDAVALDRAIETLEVDIDDEQHLTRALAGTVWSVERRRTVSAIADVEHPPSITGLSDRVAILAVSCREVEESPALAHRLASSIWRGYERVREIDVARAAEAEARLKLMALEHVLAMADSDAASSAAVEVAAVRVSVEALLRARDLQRRLDTFASEWVVPGGHVEPAGVEYLREAAAHQVAVGRSGLEQEWERLRSDSLRQNLARAAAEI